MDKNNNKFIRSLRYLFLTFVIAFGAITIVASGGGDDGSDSNGSSSTETPASELAGTYEVTDPITVYFNTGETRESMSLVGSQPWDVKFVITEGVGDNSVDIEMDFTAGEWTDIADNGWPAIPEVSPMFFTGEISDDILTIYNSNDEEVGTFSFTTETLTGTFSIYWESVYSQEEYIDEDAVLSRS